MERIARSDIDEMSLSDLIAVAHRTIIGYHAWSGWLEDYYDPAKSALVDLLAEFDVISDLVPTDSPDYDEAVRQEQERP